MQDNGPGVPPSQQAVFFEKFRQGGDAGEHPPGTGLGLPISRQIVEHLGGRLWLRSQPGQGPSFEFDLPELTNPDNGDTPDEQTRADRR